RRGDRRQTMPSFIDHRTLARSTAFALGLLGATASVRPALADDSPAAWQLRATAYGYFPDTAGTTSLPGATNIDVDARDILERTDAALMSAFEARKGRFGSFTDVIAVDLSSSVSGRREIGLIGGFVLPPGVSADASLDVKMRAATFAAEYRAYEAPRA